MPSSMSLLDLLRSPWAILPDRLDEIQAIYATHLRGDKIDLEAIEARLGKKLANEPPAYEMRGGGIAVLEISGPIAPKANLFTQISGGASAQALVRQIEAMGDNGSVRGAVIAWDSPGGSVQGIPTLERAIRALAERKPVVSVSAGTMASAAYWGGSAANAVYASGETDTVGSIGVVATHTYDPRAGARQVTEIVAGRYKRIATDSKPLTPEGEAYLQAQVDEIYAVFVQSVAANRGVSVEDVLAYMADGRVFIGRQALAAGLIDGFATAEQLAEQMAAEPQAFAQRRKAVIAAAAGASAPRAAAALQSKPSTLATEPGAAPVAPPVSEPVTLAAEPTQPTGVTMTPQEQMAKFKAEHPEAFALIQAEGVAAELARQSAVRAAALPGHEKLIEALAADGKTTGAEAALAVLAAERNLRTAQQAARAADATKPLPQEPAPAFEAPARLGTLGTGGRLSPDTDAAALDREARAYMAAHPGTTYVAAIKAVQQLQEA